MKKIIFLTKALIIYLFLYSSGISKELDFFTKGLQHFKKVVKYKPLSSKKESKEIYIFCKGISNI